MEANPGENLLYPSKAEIREQVRLQSPYPPESHLGRLLQEAKIEEEVFYGANPAELTEKDILNFLKAAETFTREKATMDLAADSSGWESSFENWTRYFEALQGIRTGGDVGATISYLRENAAFWRKRAKHTETPETQQQKTKRCNANAERNVLAARLLENRIRFKIPETGTPNTEKAK